MAFNTKSSSGFAARVDGAHGEDERMEGDSPIDVFGVENLADDAVSEIGSLSVVGDSTDYAGEGEGVVEDSLAFFCGEGEHQRPIYRRFLC